MQTKSGEEKCSSWQVSRLDTRKEKRSTSSSLLTALQHRLIGEMLSQPSLPEFLIPLCMNILSKISDGEKDLIRVIVDVVTEIRLGEDDTRMVSKSIGF